MDKTTFSDIWRVNFLTIQKVSWNLITRSYGLLFYTFHLWLIDEPMRKKNLEIMKNILRIMSCRKIYQLENGKNRRY
jgi:hypothetical protein